MYLKIQLIFLTCFVFTYNVCYTLSADVYTEFRINNVESDLENLERYLLPEDHPLHKHLGNIFSNPQMFKSLDHFRKAGFKVKGDTRRSKSGYKKVMVGAHSSCPRYLFKKFPDSNPQTIQLKNFLTRIKGAEIIRHYIQKNHCKYLVVPRKWLYQLPEPFSSKDTKSYLLIVEKMDIYEDWENPKGKARKLYYNMDQEMLTELCIALHAIGGCDAYPRNQPFTRSKQLAFIDTEHIGQKSGHFLKHTVPALNEELQAYAIALWMQLEEGKP